MSRLCHILRRTSPRVLSHFCSSSVPTPPSSVSTSSIPAGDPALRRGDVQRTKLRRLEVIHDPGLNAGTAFTPDERERLGLRGLVPPRVQPLEQQVERIYAAFSRIAGALDRFQFCSMLMDRNTVLFYVFFIKHFAEVAPVVYTPTVGEACLKFHAIYRRARGMYFSSADRGHFKSMVYNWPEDELDVVVVTDGSRVLGLGDLGANSANIPIGKISLYIAGGGINPRRTLPIVLDAGTDNVELRDNPLYLGLPMPRLKGAEYFDFIDEWMEAMRARWPNVLIQFEDFNNETALPLLEKYRHDDLVFNDDIQSTGCIATAAVLASLKARGMGISAIADERFVCAGAGSAGLGVCNSLVQAMVAAGATEEEARARFVLVDELGALGAGRSVAESQAPFVNSGIEDGVGILDAVKAFKPTVLLGLSGVGGLFDEQLVRAVAANVDRPVILPLSNPISKSECSAVDAFTWTDGRAIFASGSPFEDVDLGGGRVGATSQCNNVYSFPGMGLAVTALRTELVTDAMFHAAAVRISELAGKEQLAAGRLFPPVEELRSVSAQVAAAVAKVALKEGLVRKEPPKSALESDEAMVEFMQASMWDPQYCTLVCD